MSLKFFSNLCGLVCSFHCHTVVSWSRSDFKLFLAVEIKPAQEVAELKCPQGICVIRFGCWSFIFLALWLGPTIFTFFSFFLFKIASLCSFKNSLLVYSLVRVKKIIICRVNCKKFICVTFLVVQWLTLPAFNTGSEVRSLVRELRSHTPQGATWI